MNEIARFKHYILSRNYGAAYSIYEELYDRLSVKNNEGKSFMEIVNNIKLGFEFMSCFMKLDKMDRSFAEIIIYDYYKKINKESELKEEESFNQELNNLKEILKNKN